MSNRSYTYIYSHIQKISYYIGILPVICHLLLFFSFSLSFSLSLLLSAILSAVTQQLQFKNSTYPVLVGDYSKHLNTHTRRYFFSSKISFLYIALLKHQCVLSNQVLFENWSVNADPWPSKRKAGRQRRKEYINGFSLSIPIKTKIENEEEEDNWFFLF